MPRQKKYKQHRKIRFKVKTAKPKLNRFFAKAIFLIILFISLMFMWRISDGFFKSSQFFKVSKIDLVMNPFLKEALYIDFYGIPRGVNIFELDIDSIGHNTKKRHPEFKSVIIARRLPNIINVRILYKEPVVCLKSGSRLLPVSVDGVILPVETAQGKNLPILTGLSFQPHNTKAGFVCSDKKLFLGIKFASLAQSWWLIKGHRINLISLEDTSNISMFLENGIEIKMGDGNNLKAKLATLKKIMERQAFDLNKIAYLDLRFSDAVIGPKPLDEKKRSQLTGR